MTESDFKVRKAAVEALTDEELNQKIAEYRGWCSFTTQLGGLQGIPPNCRGWIRVPDYANDLNAIYEAENRLDNDAAHLYGQVIDTICDSESLTHHVSARKKAEAFVLTMEKVK